MTDLLSCSCGARIKIPEGAEGKLLRCPRCKAELRAPVGAGIVATTVARGSEVGATCPICQSAIRPGDGVVTCPECDQAHHPECWNEVGGCSTYGCKQAPQPVKDPPTAQPLSAWGDTKRCPACGEMIKAIALKCRYCGTTFDTVDPLTVRDLRSRILKEEGLRSVRGTTIGLFAWSVIVAILAPLNLLVAIAWAYWKREMLGRAGPAYLVLAYSAVVISLVYSLLMLLFALFSS